MANLKDFKMRRLCFLHALGIFALSHLLVISLLFFKLVGREVGVFGEPLTIVRPTVSCPGVICPFQKDNL